MTEPRRSPSEKVVVAVALLLPALCAAFLQVRSYDFWWHLESGEQILANGAIPLADDYSFTSLGKPWVDQPWLFQVVLHIVWTLLGPAGLVLLKMACAAATGLVGYMALRRAGGAATPSLVVVTLCLAGLRPRLAERPAMVTLALAALCAWLLIDLASRAGNPGRRLTLLAATSVVWTNLHGGALLAPIMAAAVLAGTLLHLPGAVEETARRLRAGARNVSVALLITGTGILVSPALHRIYLVPAQIAGALAPGNLVNPEWLSPPVTLFPFFYLALVASLLMVVTSLSRHRMPGYCGALLLLLVAAMALTSTRHIGVFFSLLPIVVASVRPGVLGRPVPLQIGVAVSAGLSAMMLLVPPSPAVTGVGVQAGRFPRKAADFIAAEMPDARLYNDASFGGYLISRGYPQRRVFLDGRNEVHADLLADLSVSIDDGRRWIALMDRHGVEGAVVRYRPESIEFVDASTGAKSRSSFSELHFPARDWALVYWDDVAMVFARKEGRFAGLAEAAGYRWVRPEAWRLGLVETEQSAAGEGLPGEILRKLEEDPNCTLAKEMSSVYRILYSPDHF